ncbi:MAG TPA: DUF2721 domain-containing protein [Anaeromyxobacteraceae bacterium]|nr:DUF2721 domain-containing protein [Anaeromyxobacteraceae bacterium]
MPPDPLFDVTRVIQLAVAPVFLLTSQGTFLAVLSTRLGRIVDRARLMADRTASSSGAARERALVELALLLRRRHLVNVAIGFGTSSALLVCVLIASAFVGSLVQRDFSVAVATLFVVAMLAFIGGLVAFLTEILVAVGNVRIAPELEDELRRRG